MKVENIQTNINREFRGFSHGFYHGPNRSDNHEYNLGCNHDWNYGSNRSAGDCYDPHQYYEYFEYLYRLEGWSPVTALPSGN